jgi:hypothetical protein
MSVSVDDVVLQSSDMTGKEAQEMMTVCSQHASDNDYSWGQGKTVALVFGKQSPGFVLRMPGGTTRCTG